MKIAFLAHAGAVHTRRWSTGLAARGHDIRLLTNNDFLGYPDNIKTDLLPGRSSLSYIFNIPRVRKILSQYQPDIVHAHYATGYGLWGAFQKQAPMVLTVWGSDIAQALEGRLFYESMVRKALRSARFITAASKFLLGETAKLEPSVQDRLVHIPFGVKLPPEETSSSENNGPVRIIFAKQFFPNYNPEMVINAFASAHKKVSNTELLMIGGGPLKDKLIKRAQSLGVSDAVKIRGWVEMEEADDLIRNSDIMVMPSKQESFGVAALQAAAAGIPVIATGVGGIPEIVENDYNGILISLGDEKALTEAIIRLVDDPMLRREMGEAGSKLARERYDFDDCLDRQEELYRQVMDN